MDGYSRMMQEARRASREGTATHHALSQTPVTDALNRWDGTYTPQALRAVHESEIADVITGRKSDGKGRIRSSKIGGCIREQTFSYLGAERDDEPMMIYPNYASHGTAMHIQWQKMGLSAGIFSAVEVDAVIPEWDFRGQADAVITDGSIFELKTTSETAIAAIIRNGPKREHVLQTTAYMIALGTDEASIVYDARGRTVQYHECRISLVRENVDELNRIVDAIHRAKADINDLPDMLEPCRTRSGTAWRYCSYTGSCLAAARGSV